MDIIDYKSIARLIRGKSDYGDDYIEKYVPPYIIKSFDDEECSVKDGFYYGYKYMCATKVFSTGENIVVIGTKPLGQCIHVLKAVRENGDIKEYMSHEVS